MVRLERRVKRLEKVILEVRELISENKDHTKEYKTDRCRSSKASRSISSYCEKMDQERKA